MRYEGQFVDLYLNMQEVGHYYPNARIKICAVNTRKNMVSG